MGSWYVAVQVVGASGRRERVRRGGFTSAKAARSAGRELLAAEVDGPLTAGCAVGQWLRYWLSVVESRLRPTTHRAYRDHVRLYLVPYLGRIELALLSRREGTRMFLALGRRRNRYGAPISASTLQRIRATLRAALNHAVREDLIAANPTQGVRLPRCGRIRWCGRHDGRPPGGATGNARRWRCGRWGNWPPSCASPDRIAYMRATTEQPPVLDHC
jgi:hypothetical protein